MSRGEIILLTMLEHFSCGMILIMGLLSTKNGSAKNVSNSHIKIQNDRINEFCRRWKISEFSLFGSVLRDDFNADSDIDVLVDFLPDANWSLYDWIDMIDELTAIFGRKVDLVCKEGLRNPYRREEILRNQEVIYAA